jgi:hypothetical protein
VAKIFVSCLHDLVSNGMFGWAACGGLANALFVHENRSSAKILN